MLRDIETTNMDVSLYVDKPTIEQAATLRLDMGTATILNINSIKKINAISYANQFYPQLANFLDYFYAQFYNIVDMIKNAADINTIISAARSLREFINTKVESLNYIPGAESLVAELVRCETLLLDILQDLMDSAPLGIVLQRINYMKRLLVKITDSFNN